MIAALKQALLDHELVKVKLAQGVEDRAQTAAELAEGTESEVAQTLGRTLLLFRQHPKKAKLVLPAPKKSQTITPLIEEADDDAPEGSDDDEAGED